MSNHKPASSRSLRLRRQLLNDVNVETDDIPAIHTSNEHEKSHEHQMPIEEENITFDNANGIEEPIQKATPGIAQSQNVTNS